MAGRNEGRERSAVGTTFHAWERAVGRAKDSSPGETGVLPRNRSWRRQRDEGVSERRRWCRDSGGGGGGA